MFRFIAIMAVMGILSAYPRFALRCIVLYALYEAFCWEPLFAGFGVALILAYQVGKAIGLRSAAAGVASAPDRQSDMTDQSARASSDHLSKEVVWTVIGTSVQTQPAQPGSTGA
jgi:hypothetical protein